MSVVNSVLLLPVLILLPLIVNEATAGAGKDGLPKLMLVTFDGLGWNFLEKRPLPSFEAFMDDGVHVRWVENVFPTMTRPNHMTLVTGLYAESHGIVGNVFYDKKLDADMPKQGELQENDSQWVDVGAEPLWVTNSKAGSGRRSGTVLWPCSDAKIQERLPDEIMKGEWKVNETAFSAIQRIDLALDWLSGKTESKKPVNFVAVYTEEPDEQSHRFGPDSQEVLDALKSRDDVVKHLLSELKERKLEDEVNVIITADHGQMPLYPEAVINMDLLLDPAWYTAIPSLGHTAFSNVWPKEGFYDKVVEAVRGKHRNLRVATSADSGELVKLHYATSPRIAPVVLYAEPGWVLGTNTPTTLKGGHGWDPRYCSQMWPFFMARGPAFKKGVRNADPFHMVDLYPLMCYVLGVNPAPNNGSLSKAAHILASHHTSAGAGEQGSVNYTWVAIGLLVAILGVVVAMVVLRYVRSNKNVSAAYKRTFARAGSTDDMVDEGMVVISDEEL